MPRDFVWTGGAGGPYGNNRSTVPNVCSPPQGLVIAVYKSGSVLIGLSISFAAYTTAILVINGEFGYLAFWLRVVDLATGFSVSTTVAGHYRRLEPAVLAGFA